MGDLAGDGYRLSPVLASGSDPVVKGTTWNTTTGTVTVPPRTVTVLVDDQLRTRWPWWNGR